APWRLSSREPTPPPEPPRGAALAWWTRLCLATSGRPQPRPGDHLWRDDDVPRRTQGHNKTPGGAGAGGGGAPCGSPHYARGALVHIVSVALPPVGTTVTGGQTFGEVEST